MVLSFVCFPEKCEKFGFESQSPFYRNTFSPLKKKDFPCFFVNFKILLNGVGQPTSIVICSHINENTVALTY